MIAARDRHLDWEGCWNVRDLGGLLTADGRAIRPGALGRADAVDRLTSAGWAALQAHGIRTVIDLRNDDEREAGAAEPPPGIAAVHLPLDGIEDREFWDRWGSGPQFGTPLYYGPHLERFPQRSAAVVAAIAHAPPGGVLFHCVGGRDRTGMVALLVLALAGVAPEDIAADYALSAERLRPFYARSGQEDQGVAIDEFLAGRGTSATEAIASLLADLDVEALLGQAGLREQDVAALRDRLLAPA